MRHSALSVGFDFTKSGLEVLGTKLCKILVYQRQSMQLPGNEMEIHLSVHLINSGSSEGGEHFFVPPFA